jgi:hypothetical protein
LFADSDHGVLTQQDAPHKNKIPKGVILNEEKHEILFLFHKEQLLSFLDSLQMESRQERGRLQAPNLCHSLLCIPFSSCETMRNLPLECEQYLLLRGQERTPSLPPQTVHNFSKQNQFEGSVIKKMLKGTRRKSNGGITREKRERERERRRRFFS